MVVGKFARVLVIFLLAMGGAVSAQGATGTIKFSHGYVLLPNAHEWRAVNILKPFTVSGGASVTAVGPYHSLAAAVLSIVPPKASEKKILADPQSHLKHLANARADSTQSRYKLIKFEHFASRWKGNSCRDYRMVLEDNGEPEREWGRICILTEAGGGIISVITIYYREMRMPTDKPYPHFEREAKIFLNSIFLKK